MFNLSFAGRRHALVPACVAAATAACLALAGRASAKPPENVPGQPKPQSPRAAELPPSVKRDLQAGAAQVGPPAPGQASHAGHSHAAGAPGTPTPTVVLKPGEAPKIEFDMTIYDFGKIKAGADIVHDFWFTNTGTGPLEILQVKPS